MPTMVRAERREWRLTCEGESDLDGPGKFAREPVRGTSYSTMALNVLWSGETFMQDTRDRLIVEIGSGADSCEQRKMANQARDWSWV